MTKSCSQFEFVEGFQIVSRCGRDNDKVLYERQILINGYTPAAALRMCAPEGIGGGLKTGPNL